GTEPQRLVREAVHPHRAAGLRQHGGEVLRTGRQSAMAHRDADGRNEERVTVLQLAQQKLEVAREPEALVEAAVTLEERAVVHEPGMGNAGRVAAKHASRLRPG